MESGKDKRGNSEKNTIIFVNVDTRNIQQGEIDKYVFFSDDNDDTLQASASLKDYVTLIERGMKVYWKGVAQEADSEDIVEITAVESKEGKKDWKLLENVASERGNNGVKVGKVRGKLIREQEAYSIKFRINGGSGNEYLVDPKLQMRT